MKVLVVYYSWTGSTRKLAQKITSKLKCDVEEIYEKNRRKGRLGFMLAGFEAVLGLKPAIDIPKHDPSEYDLVLLGGPIWAGRIAAPVRTYLSKIDSVKEIAFFCSKGGGKHEKVVENITELTGKKPSAILAVKKDELPKAEVDGFLKKLKLI